MFQVNQSLGYLLGLAGKKTVNRFMQLLQQEGIDIGFSGWIVLSRLWEEDGLSQQEISVRSGVAKPNISTYIDSLEQKNYVVRIDDPQDRRNYKIHLTQKAKSLMDQCQALARQSNEETVQKLNAVEREQLLALLQKIAS